MKRKKKCKIPTYNFINKLVSFGSKVRISKRIIVFLFKVVIRRGQCCIKCETLHVIQRNLEQTRDTTTMLEGSKKLDRLFFICHFIIARTGFGSGVTLQSVLFYDLDTLSQSRFTGTRQSDSIDRITSMTLTGSTNLNSQEQKGCNNKRRR